MKHPHLSASELASLEARLLKERDRVVRANGALRETVDAGTDDGRIGGDIGDAGSAMAAREHAAVLASRAGRAFSDIEDALVLLRATPDRYGHCVQCGGAIPFARLDFLPTTRLCVSHAG